MTNFSAIPIEKFAVSAYKIPTDQPESDGTFEWDSTTIVLVQAEAGGIASLGYTYADEATAKLIDSHLKGVVLGRDAFSPNDAFVAMTQSIRNLGRPGIASMAISAVDTALWDLKARLLDLPLVRLFGQVRAGMPLYGSGGFTSYTNEKLQEQFSDWVGEGITRVKMKVGREPQADIERVAAAREAIGDETELFVDANGAYSRKQALELAYAFSEFDVSWFEEPVSSDDLPGLRMMRDAVDRIRGLRVARLGQLQGGAFTGEDKTPLTAHDQLVAISSGLLVWVGKKRVKRIELVGFG